MFLNRILSQYPAEKTRPASQSQSLARYRARFRTTAYRGGFPPLTKSAGRIDEAINKRSGRPGANDPTAGTFYWNIKVTSQIYARQATGKDSRFSSGNMRYGVDKSGALSSLFPRASRFGGEISRVRLSPKYRQAFSVVGLITEGSASVVVRCVRMLIIGQQWNRHRFRLLP